MVACVAGRQPCAAQVLAASGRRARAEAAALPSHLHQRQRPRKLAVANGVGRGHLSDGGQYVPLMGRHRRGSQHPQSQLAQRLPSGCRGFAELIHASCGRLVRAGEIPPLQCLQCLYSPSAKLTSRPLLCASTAAVASSRFGPAAHPAGCPAFGPPCRQGGQPLASPVPSLRAWDWLRCRSPPPAGTRSMPTCCLCAQRCTLTGQLLEQAHRRLPLCCTLTHSHVGHSMRCIWHPRRAVPVCRGDDNDLGAVRLDEGTGLLVLFYRGRWRFDGDLVFFVGEDEPLPAFLARRRGC
mmetsp:Transcript_21936/g.66655  ORF Transcript_21936/g.66655 Transcript_21936/m.66655 type:complete len:295 (-) Transcript_21936:357-1241(-)